MGLNDDILNEIIGHKVDLLRFSESTRRKVLNLLNALGEDVQQSIKDVDLAGITKTAFQQRRQETLINQVASTIETAYRGNDELLDSELLDVGKVSAKFAKNLLNDSFQSGIAATTITPKDLKELVTNNLIEGAPSADWWSKQSLDLQHRFAQQVRMGVAQGETNDQIVQRIRGKYTGKNEVVELEDGTTKVVREFAGGVMDISTRDATSLVRTSVQTISNNVLDATYRDNQDVLRGLQAVATLDLRTTILCRAMDGTMWDFEGNILPESPVKNPWRGPPPWHWQCRTVISPITKSWAELAKDAGKSGAAIKEIPQSVRASMDGEVPAGLTYQDWLKTQSVAKQKESFGSDTKWQLWSDGKLTFQEMIDQSGNPLTLEQLQAKVDGGSKVPEPPAPSMPTLPIPWTRDFTSAIPDGLDKSEEQVRQTLGITKDDLVGVTAPDAELFPELKVQWAIQEANKTGLRVYWTRGENQIDRFLYKDDTGALVLANRKFFLGEDMQGKGTGSMFFYSQAKNAQQAGITRIETEAVRGPDFNGYYTWPRMGYDGDLPKAITSKLPQQFSGFTKVSQLMDTPEGRTWWKKNGDDIDLTFDLAEGSRSMQVLEAYMRDRMTNAR